ncbi:hypothetical protein M0R04_08485 [Candidatus Dojkabacteria bacterium]|jgi:hypothetical protein|nr:hypothetical protein [Candidatus Dojkabacteria bacterium]
MAKLTLTKKEINAVFLNDFDDEALGKVVKSLMANIVTTSDEQGKTFILSAAMVLCQVAHKTNADTMKVTVDGLRNKGNDFGNWTVTIKKIK